jgi:hypothetical protein
MKKNDVSPIMNDATTVTKAVEEWVDDAAGWKFWMVKFLKIQVYFGSNAVRI